MELNNDFNSINSLINLLKETLTENKDVMTEIDESLNHSMISNSFSSNIYIKQKITKSKRETESNNSTTRKDLKDFNRKDDYFTQNLNQKRVFTTRSKSKSKEKIKLASVESVDNDRDFRKFNKIMNKFIDENKDNFDNLKYEERKDDY